MSGLGRRVDPRGWAVVACGLGLALGGALMLPVGGLADETVHYPQIRSLLEAFPDGPWTLHPRLTTFPTYHAVVAVVLKLTGTSGLTAARTVNVALSAALLALFAALALRIHRRRSPAARRAVQLAFLPILFPFFFLVYTDVLSLLVVLLAVLLADRPHPVLAPLAALGAVLVRQTNVVWVIFIALVHVRALAQGSQLPSETSGESARWRRLAVHAAPYALIGAATAGFAWAHGGLALGDPAAHPPGVLHGANVYFLLFVLLGCFLPLHLPALGLVLGRLFHGLRRRSWRNRWALAAVAVAALATGFLFFAWTFEITHPYNRFLGSLRNRALDFFAHGRFGPLVLFATNVAAVLALVGTRLKRPLAYALYPLTVAFLAAHWLVEQRYFFIPLALWLVYREEAPPWAERLQLAWGIVLTGILHLGVVNRWFFL